MQGVGQRNFLAAAEAGWGGARMGAFVVDSLARENGMGEQREAQRARRLWWAATGLLMAMGAIFVVMHLRIVEVWWAPLVRAFAEAALVGALADWFAVTALFRYPLGVPIPHTAIIPRNKRRIGRSLGQFVEQNFFTADVLTGESINIAGALTAWLGQPAQRRAVVERLRVFLPQVLTTIEGGEVRKFLTRQILNVVGQVDLAQLVATCMRSLTVSGVHERVLNEGLRHAQGFLRTNHEWLRRQLRAASPWFVPDFVDKRIFEAIIAKTEETLGQALADERHELRQRIHAAVLHFVESLESCPHTRAQFEELRSTVLASESVREFVGSLRIDLSAQLQADLAAPESLFLQSAERILADFVTAVSESAEIQLSVNRAVRSLLSALVGEHGGKVSGLIEQTIESWDSSTIVEKLQQEVGPDLQYIRINGTLVGGTVGVVLHLLFPG